MDIYADSLRMRNRELNRTLNKLINDLDEQAQTAFSQRELKMAEAEKMSFFLMAGVIGMAIILLIISHLIIMRDLNRRERDKAELEDTATQNRTLSDMRKKIIITLPMTYEDLSMPSVAVLNWPWILVTGNAAMPISETSLNHPVISPGLPTACLTSPVWTMLKKP